MELVNLPVDTAVLAPAPAPVQPELEQPVIQAPAIEKLVEREIPKIVEAPPPPPPEPEPPPAPKPTPKPKPAPETPPKKPTPEKKPSPAPQQTITAEDFFSKHGRPSPPSPKPRQTQPAQTITAPRIDVSKITQNLNQFLESSSSSNRMTEQEQSAMLAYIGRLKHLIEIAWDKPASLAGREISAEVLITLSPSGQVTNVRFSRRSGNGAFDDSVIAAVRNARSAGAIPTGRSETVRLTFEMIER